MYKVFVNNQSIQFVKNFNNQLFENENIEVYQYFSNKALLSAISDFIDKNITKQLYIYCPDKLAEVFSFFKSKYIEVKASGGLVKNKNEKYLFIFRREKWDLPKGKIDKGETIKECAIREVEEETGIDNLKIIKKLPDTYHIYNENSKLILKHCYWFLMQTDSEKELKPQTNEDITKAKWLESNEFDKVYANTFASVDGLLRNYFKISD
jgi:8-oxo-dGTP pyrophosphatase MutT (NUDIX family)